MVRTQVQLTETQTLRLKELAASEGVSIATLIRRSIDRYMMESEHTERALRKARALAVVGRYASPHSDVSQQHDRHLAELYAEVGS